MTRGRPAIKDAECAAYVRETAAGFSPLTEEQKVRLSMLWRPGAEIMWAAIREREAGARPAPDRGRRR